MNTPPNPQGKEANYELFEEAMLEFGKLAKFALKTLRPYKNHSGNCLTNCPPCELKVAYWKIKNEMVTEINR